MLTEVNPGDNLWINEPGYEYFVECLNGVGLCGCSYFSVWSEQHLDNVHQRRNLNSRLNIRNPSLNDSVQDALVHTKPPLMYIYFQNKS